MRSKSVASEGDKKTIKTATTVPFTKGDEKNERFSEGDENKKAIPTALWAPPLIVEEELKKTANNCPLSKGGREKQMFFGRGIKTKQC